LCPCRLLPGVVAADTNAAVSSAGIARAIVVAAVSSSIGSAVANAAVTDGTIASAPVTGGTIASAPVGSIGSRHGGASVVLNAAGPDARIADVIASPGLDRRALQQNRQSGDHYWNE
jgi:hypothetical protein